MAQSQSYLYRSSTKRDTSPKQLQLAHPTDSYCHSSLFPPWTCLGATASNELATKRKSDSDSNDGSETVDNPMFILVLLHGTAFFVSEFSLNMYSRSIPIWLGNKWESSTYLCWCPCWFPVKPCERYSRSGRKPEGVWGLWRCLRAFETSQMIKRNTLYAFVNYACSSPRQQVSHAQLWDECQLSVVWAGTHLLRSSQKLIHLTLYNLNIEHPKISIMCRDCAMEQPFIVRSCAKPSDTVWWVMMGGAGNGKWLISLGDERIEGFSIPPEVPLSTGGEWEWTVTWPTLLPGLSSYLRAYIISTSPVNARPTTPQAPKPKCKPNPNCRS
jgi:hypothetical protein